MALIARILRSRDRSRSAVVLLVLRLVLRLLLLIAVLGVLGVLRLIAIAGLLGRRLGSRPSASPTCVLAHACNVPGLRLSLRRTAAGLPPPRRAAGARRPGRAGPPPH